MSGQGEDLVTAATDNPSILYVGKFDITSILDACHKGLNPAQHIHAVSELQNYGYRLKVIDTNFFSQSSKFDFSLKVFRTAKNCDLILAHNIYDVRPLSIMRSLKILDIPLTAFVHSISKSVADHIILKGFDKLFVLSESGKSDLIECGVPPNNIVYFPYGADASFYKPRKAVNTHILSVGVCGRDFDTLISAAEQVQANFVLVGQLTDKQKKMAGPNVMLYADRNYGLPFDDLLNLYNQAHLVVITHHGTPHPFGINALLEAMAMGKAVILTEGTGIDIDPATFGFGLKVPPHDPMALKKAIQTLLSDKDLLDKMGSKARELVEQKFNTRNMGQTLYCGIKDALNRRHSACRF